MCGLAGVLDLKAQRRPDQAMLRRMADALLHRGPDDAGFFVAPGIGLAHRRLSVVGLSDGRAAADSSTRIEASSLSATEGLYSIFSKGVQELEAKGHVFCTHSDSEIIVHLYEEHGDGLFQHLKGQFAFVLVDLKRRIVPPRASTASAFALSTGHGRAMRFISGQRSRRSSPLAPLHQLPIRAGSTISLPSSRLRRAARCFKACRPSHLGTI